MSAACSAGGRSATDATKNNEARKLFRDAVADMFGGEQNIPESVKTAMLLKDYGTEENPSGKPLTARRIMAVKAEVDRIVAVHAAFNNEITDKLFHCNFNELPQEFQAGLAETADRLRNVFGEAAVPKPCVISDILHIRFVKNTFENLRDAATAQGRDLTAQEITAAYGGAAFERLATNAVGLAILRGQVPHQRRRPLRGEREERPDLRECRRVRAGAPKPGRNREESARHGSGEVPRGRGEDGGFGARGLTQEKNFNKEKYPGLCQDFLNDLGRSAAYTVNGTRLAGAAFKYGIICAKRPNGCNLPPRGV